MFRDREKALQELQKQLLEEEEEMPPEEEPEEDDNDLPQEVYDDYAEDVRAYNSDRADTELDSYSEDVYYEPKRRSGCVLWFVLLTAAVLLALSYFLAKQGGVL